MRHSRRRVPITRSQNAFARGARKGATVGIVADLLELLPVLTEKIKKSQ